MVHLSLALALQLVGASLAAPPQDTGDTAQPPDTGDTGEGDDTGDTAAGGGDGGGDGGGLSGRPEDEDEQVSQGRSFCRGCDDTSFGLVGAMLLVPLLRRRPRRG